MQRALNQLSIGTFGGAEIASNVATSRNENWPFILLGFATTTTGCTQPPVESLDSIER